MILRNPSLISVHSGKNSYLVFLTVISVNIRSYHGFQVLVSLKLVFCGNSVCI